MSTLSYADAVKDRLLTPCLPAAYYAQPVPVPVYLSHTAAREAFFAGELVYSRPGPKCRAYHAVNGPDDTRLTPEHASNPAYLRYARTYAQLVAEANAIAHSVRRFGSVCPAGIWEAFVNVALSQPHLRRTMTGHTGYVDFYVFRDAEISVVAGTTPEPGAPFELRWSSERRFYYFNMYVGAAAKPKKKKVA